MDLRQIMYFMCVYKEGSFTKAAPPTFLKALLASHPCASAGPVERRQAPHRDGRGGARGKAGAVEGAVHPARRKQSEEKPTESIAHVGLIAPIRIGYLKPSLRRFILPDETRRGP